MKSMFGGRMDMGTYFVPSPLIQTHLTSLRCQMLHATVLQTNINTIELVSVPYVFDFVISPRFPCTSYVFTRKPMNHKLMFAPMLLNHKLMNLFHSCFLVNHPGYHPASSTQVTPCAAPLSARHWRWCLGHSLGSHGFLGPARGRDAGDTRRIAGGGWAGWWGIWWCHQPPSLWRWQ